MLTIFLLPALAAFLVFVVSRCLAVGPRQGRGYRERRAKAWDGPARYHYTRK